MPQFVGIGTGHAVSLGKHRGYSEGDRAAEHRTVTPEAGGQKGRNSESPGMSRRGFPACSQGSERALSTRGKRRNPVNEAMMPGKLRLA